MLKGISAYVWVGVFFSVLISSYIVASYLISIHRNMIRDWKIMRFIRASDYIEALVKSIYSSSSPLTVRSLGETAKTKEKTYAICYGNITNPLDEKFWKDVELNFSNYFLDSYINVFRNLESWTDERNVFDEFRITVGSLSQSEIEEKGVRVNLSGITLNAYIKEKPSLMGGQSESLGVEFNRKFDLYFYFPTLFNKSYQWLNKTLKKVRDELPSVIDKALGLAEQSIGCGFETSPDPTCTGLKKVKYESDERFCSLAKRDSTYDFTQLCLEETSCEDVLIQNSIDIELQAICSTRIHKVSARKLC